MEEIALYALHVDDDPSLNPWTFRTWFLGIGLSCFSAVLATIYQFKPQGIVLSATFLCVISYVLALVLEYIPKSGFLGRWLNPHSFNHKEHAAILIMSSTAARSAMAAEVIAVQRLWYTKTPNAAVCIFLIFSSQILGYGVAGLLRKILVYPTKFFYPANLPIMSLLETLHRKKVDTKPQLKLFYWAFAIIFVWELIPEYIMPILTAVSVFCLANQKSLVFTNIFGGGNGNEGLGFLSLCFDFQYIGSGALYLPLKTQFNTMVGYCLNIAVFLGIFYGNIWRAKDFPFLSQLLFSPESNSTSYVTFNQTAVLNEHGVLDESKLATTGIPYMAATFASYVLTQNMAITATLTHMCLYHWDDLKSAFDFMSLASIKSLVKPSTWMFWKKESRTEEETANMDPHYKLMLRYKDAPDWWYGLVFLASGVVGLICIYEADSGMAWWAFIVSVILASIMILFMGAQYGLTGFQLHVQPIIQMIGAYLEPGRPLTNMYFTLFGYNSVGQGMLLLQDLKLGQYAKLSPRCTFAMQMVGTLVGAILNYVITLSITTNQREILLSIEGTHIWSGAALQSFNTQAITWGGLAKQMYSWGSTYQWVPLGLVIGFAAPLPGYFLHRLFPKVGFNHLNMSIICWHIGWLVTGINSAIISFLAVAFWSQYYLRRYKPEWFLKYNYVLCAGLDGGTQVIVFIMTFVFFGASGKPIPFPNYWGNNANGNIDFCKLNPANSG
ncbi:OPT superfamily oligopeptide transporter [Mollisia scopiformis]|uniref:OPT superfamily oligopeptide transporter n=1 Tax=Mollisia scopiformis TaxID=149040 RepID=A0A194XG65_MOLSC|nr:OPT superfamily oligopeptide transporter [Mollisia scopiformis]KUJ19163.1 OPT superfamily oligopeptide transporter [Mollisia scopiformis]